VIIAGLWALMRVPVGCTATTYWPITSPRTIATRCFSRGV
jgi:hypothetical protein